MSHPDHSLTIPLIDFLQQPLVTSLLATHPNNIYSSTSPPFEIPPAWDSWWDWYATMEGESQKWVNLLEVYYGDAKNSHTIPHEILDFISTARRLQLDRTPVEIPNATHPGPSSVRANIHGMSPKKSHEVSRMTAYIQALISARPALNNVKHIVDVGAGQGYLSRALRDLGFHVLALDGNAVQTKGAERRDRVPPKGSRTASHGTEKATDLPGSPHDARRNSSGKGSLSHQTIYITASTLRAAVSSWLHSEGPHDDDSSPPIPVLIVALHACGSLTPDIFRAFFACRADSELLSVNNDTSNHPERMSWLAKGAVIVGCCYNLLEPEVDFPLSRRCSRSPPLTASHLQLAAQMPAHWLDNATSRSAAYLSVKKVAYRALLEAFLPSPEDEHHEDVIQGDRSPLAGSNFKNRLGRLSDSAYTSFPHFLSCAFAKLGTSSSALPLGSELRVGITGPCVDSPDFRTMQQRVEVLHVLRCLIGPSVESLILLDRIAWLKETLQDSGSGAIGGTRWDVELVNLFDQAMGSGRNTALLVAPFE